MDERCNACVGSTQGLGSLYFPVKASKKMKYFWGLYVLDRITYGSTGPDEMLYNLTRDHGI